MGAAPAPPADIRGGRGAAPAPAPAGDMGGGMGGAPAPAEIGRAAWRGRVEISVVGGSVKKKKGGPAPAGGGGGAGRERVEHTVVPGTGRKQLASRRVGAECRAVLDPRAATSVPHVVA